MLGLLASLALAGPLQLAAPEGGTAVVLPRSAAGRIDVLVRPVSPDLRQPRPPAPAGVRAVRVVDLGGTAVVTLWPLDPLAHGRVDRRGAFWEVSLIDAAPLVGGIAPAPDGFAADDPGCGGAPRVPLVPLYGADMVTSFLPGELAVELPVWTSAEPKQVSWSRVAEVRAGLSVLATEGGAEARAALTYELGALHRDLGFSREAAYYFGAAGPTGEAAGIVELQRAGALLRTRDWERARLSAAAAVRLGAPEDSALEVQGLAHLFGAAAPGPAAGLALEASSPGPEASLIAGALLLRSGCFSAAAAPLRRAGIATSNTRAATTRAAMARLLLADALLLQGEVEGVAETLKGMRGGDLPARWRGSFRTRSRIVAMLGALSTTWPAMVPTLDRLGRNWDEEAAESLFLLGQIGEYLGDEGLALESFVTLVDRWRPLADGEPGRRLRAAWGARTSGLFREGRDIDALAVHATFWRPQLLAGLTDPAPLAAVADGYARVGLPDPALETLTDLANAEGRLKRDDRATIVAIAKAYEATGRLDELSDTLDFLAARPPDPLVAAQVALLRARLHEQRGSPAAARTVLVGVSSPAAQAGEAARTLALLDADADRCADALRGLPAEPDPALLPRSGVLLAARARCLLALDREEEGRESAKGAAKHLTDPASIAALQYLSGEPAAAEASDIWAHISRAEASWEALRSRATKKDSTSSTTAR